MENFIGIFWIHEDDIYGKREIISSIPVIDNVQDIETGHVQYWEVLQSNYLKFRAFGYDNIPRGRVLKKGDEFIVYSSQNILQNYQDLIVDYFEIDKESVKFLVDEHYSPILDLGFEIFD